MLPFVHPFFVGAQKVERVGFTSHDEFSAGIALPVGSIVGDLALIYYYSAVSITGGSGTAWNTGATLGSAVMKWRRLEAGDFVTPLALTGNSPVVVAVFRGVLTVSAVRTSGATTGTGGPPNYRYTISGFTKAPNCGAIIGLTYSVGGGGDFDPPPSWVREVNGPTAFFLVMATETQVENYTNAATFSIVSTTGTDTTYSAVIELLF